MCLTVDGQVLWYLYEKKDGKLGFYIGLRRLNAWTVRDAYSLPQIEKMLDCLNGTVCFTS